MLRPRLGPRFKRTLALSALLPGAALALVACGGSDATTASTAGSATSTAATATTPTTSSTTTTEATTTTSTGASDLRQAFDNSLRTDLVQKQGLSGKQADCVLNELQKTLPDSQIQATISGQAPKAVTDAAFKAGLKCANQ